MTQRTRTEDYAMRGLLYMLVDGAGGEKENTSDYTCVQMWATQSDETIVLIDAIWDRLDPLARVEGVLDMYSKWSGYRFQECRYESYAMDSDIFWLKKYQTDRGLHFKTEKVAGVQKNRKAKAITGRVIPLFKSQKILLPEVMMRPCKHLGGGDLDLMQSFTSEIIGWPLVEHDDWLDCMSRLVEPNLILHYPEPEQRAYDMYARASVQQRTGAQPDAMAPWGN